MTTRLDSLRHYLSENSLDAVLVSSQPTITYLTGYHGFSQLEREAYLLITHNSAFLFTDTRYSEATTTSVPHFTTLLLTIENPLSSHLAKIMKKSKARIGFETDNVTIAEYAKIKKSKLKFTPLSLRKIRIQKDQEEIQKIKKAAAIAKRSLMSIMSRIKPGMTETDVAKLLEGEIRSYGGSVSFPTIVAFGKNASVPHHFTGKTKLRSTDLVLIDFGARYEGYCSDCTRTFFIGAIPQEWKKIYQTVKNAQQQAISSLTSLIKNHKSGVEASLIDKVARDYIISKGYPTIPHSLGHGIGLEVHEAPRLSPASDDLIDEGMVFSIEPGIYLPKEGGVRIEDLFTIQGSNLIKLT